MCCASGDEPVREVPVVRVQVLTAMSTKIVTVTPCRLVNSYPGSEDPARTTRPLDFSATLFLDCLIVAMKVLPSLEMSVNIYQSTRRDIPEYLNTKFLFF